LAVALRKRLESVESRAGIQTHIEVENLFSLSGQEEENLFWIAMEALNNSLRHALATEVNIRIKSDTDVTLLSISDNGKGFDPEKGRQSGGMGLQNMQHRAQKIGGRLEILSSPGKGVQINVILPNHQ
jgi:signal transduction histidine kinase